MSVRRCHRKALRLLKKNATADKMRRQTKTKEPRGCQNETIPEEGRIHRTYNIFANFMQNICDKTTLKKKCFTTVPNVLGPKMRPSRWRAKSTVPIVSLQILLKTFFCETRQKQKNPKGTQILAAKTRRSRRRAKSTVTIRTVVIREISLETIFSTKKLEKI